MQDNLRGRFTPESSWHSAETFVRSFVSNFPQSRNTMSAGRLWQLHMSTQTSLFAISYSQPRTSMAVNLSVWLDAL